MIGGAVGDTSGMEIDMEIAIDAEIVGTGGGGTMVVVDGRRSGWGTGLMDGPAGMMLKPSEVVTGMICAVVRCARAARRGRAVL